MKSYASIKNSKDLTTKEYVDENQALYIVTVRNDKSDKTPKEILAAYNKGQYIVCRYMDGVAKQRSGHYDLVRVDENTAVFEGVTKLTESQGSTWISVMNIDVNKVVTFKDGEESRMFLASGTGAGGSVSGNIQATGVVSGSWLQTKNITDATPTKNNRLAVIDPEGWIYVGNIDDMISAVKYEEQTLTEAQQAQAKTNIGAASYTVVRRW